MYDLALLYFLLALLTPYFNEYSIRDCLYLMSCVMLFMKDLAPFVQFGVATQLYHMSQSFFSFLLLSKMYCSATKNLKLFCKKDLQFQNEFAIIIKLI